MELQRVFDNFKLENLDKEWVQFVWDTQFVSFKGLSNEYIMFLENENMKLLLKESCTIVKKWLLGTTNHVDPNYETTEVSWNTLVVLNVNLHGLLAILGYLIKNGQRSEANEDARQYSLKATSLYFMLLAVPGSSAFNVFHPTLYQSAIISLKMSEQLLPATKKNCKTLDAKKLLTNEDQMNNHLSLTNAEKLLLTKRLNSVICDFILMTRSFTFKDHIHSLDSTIELLLDVTRLETDIQYLQMQSQEMQSGLVMSLSNNAYVALWKLCDTKHGPIDVTTMLIAKHLLPRFIISQTDLQTKIMTNTREASIYFLRNILYAYEDESKKAVTTLIQQLMIRCPERVEARQKQAAILSKVLNVCTKNIFLDAVKNIMLLSHNTKAMCRIFAQEVIGQFLSDSFPEDFASTNTLKSKIKNILVALVLSRCTDSSSLVRGKAMAIVSDLLEANNSVNQLTLQDIFDTDNSEKPFCSFEELNNALVTDINPLPGLNTAISMFMIRMEDERALVRRSAIQILKNIIIMSPRLITRVSPIISRRCRDPAVTVRRFAIQMLSQILDQFSYSVELVDEWVASVVPQIFDTDNKVQEKVLESLKELMLNRIKDVTTYSCDVNDTLPWKIIHTLTDFKMRNHLSKACSLWIKNGVITEITVKNIQSHIGTDNNIPAWVLLAALGQNMKLPNVNKYIVNYKEVLKDNNFYTSLVLEVIRNSWKSLSREVLKDLHSYLYNCLCKFEIGFGLIGICLDVINKVSQNLNPNNASSLLGSNMIKLMKLSEREIAKVLNSVSKAANKLPCYLKAMATLGHSALYCTRQISARTLRILQGFILEWEALPISVKKMEALQPMAVALLGQQALRDREVAKEVIPIFGRLMRQETSLSLRSKASVKINAAKALADLCIRFTALVEPYLSDMCVSMKDPDAAVRQAIVVIFIQLLLEDFVKIKGPFFFHILTMLSDPDPTIQELTVFLVEERLLVKNKTLIFQQFIESIYHYNNYRHQHSFCDRKMLDREKKALTFPGKKNQGKRRVIYDFMLDHLDPAGKIKLLVKLTVQVVGGACNGVLDVRTEEGACILKDALYVISNEKLQPTSANKYTDENAEHEEPTLRQQNSNVSNAINVIIEGMKKHSLDVLLPMLIKLRMKLASCKSSLEKDVRKLLVNLYLSYNKEQVARLLNEYPKLEQDVEHFKKSLSEEMCTDNDDTHVEESASSTTSVQNKLNENQCLSIDSNRLPRVVLRRLSPTTCSRISNYKSMSSLSHSDFQYPLSRPSSRYSCTSIRSGILDISSPEPGPSTSTPFSVTSPDRVDVLTRNRAKGIKRRLMTFSSTSSSKDFKDFTTVKKRPAQNDAENDSD